MSKLMAFTGTVLKNLFSPPVTKNYPEEPAVFQERTRGHIVIDIDKCLFCGSCARNCPSLALAVDRHTGTWSISRFDCVQCGYCTDVCPGKCLSIVPGYTEPAAAKSVEKITRPNYEAPQSRGKVDKSGTTIEIPVPPNSHPVMDPEKCIYCTLCARKCPGHAITVDRAAKKWEFSDPDACISCGACATGCKKGAITMKE